MDKIRLVIVDDHSIFREGLLSVLKTEPDIEIVGEGAMPRMLFVWRVSIYQISFCWISACLGVG